MPRSDYTIYNPASIYHLPASTVRQCSLTDLRGQTCSLALLLLTSWLCVVTGKSLRTGCSFKIIKSSDSPRKNQNGSRSYQENISSLGKGPHQKIQEQVFHSFSSFSHTPSYCFPPAVGRGIGAFVTFVGCSIIQTIISGIFKKILAVFFMGFLAWAYQATRPPPPKTCGSVDGPPVTAPRIKLRDGRHLAYKEYGVPKYKAKHKIVFVHGFRCCRHDAAITATLSPDIIESLAIYIISFDRPGYGESDPNPNRTLKSMAFDVEELADWLGLGTKFYVIGFSMGGQALWPCLKYIPHRLAGAALLAPVVNYWWPGFPANLSNEVYKQQLPQDQWALRVAHYASWLTYWWNTQKLFSPSAVVAQSPLLLSHQDLELVGMDSTREYETQITHQGEYESLHRDLIVGFGNWEFDPMDLENPFPNSEGSVHIWQGDEDRLVPASLQQYIAERLPWIHYHEISGAGHMFPFAEGMGDNIVKTLLIEESGLP